MDNLLNDVVISQPSAAVAAGTSEIDGTGIDMSGFDEITIIAALGTVTSTGVDVLKIQESNDNGNTDPWADITGATTGSQTNKSNKLLVVSAWRPVKRYVRGVLLPTVANTALNVMLAIQSKASKKPTVQSGDVAAAVLVAPTA